MKPKILLLDSIHQDGLEIFKTFSHVDDGRFLTPQKVLETISNYHGIIIKSGNVINEKIINCAKKLKVIARAGSGTDNIDLEAARIREIQVFTSPSGNVCSVAEYVVCMMLFLSHRLQEAHLGALQKDFRRANWQGRNLANLTVGLVGMGLIGKAVAAKLQNLTNSILAYDPYCEDRTSLEKMGVIFFDDIHEMLKKVNVLSLHVPLLPSTHHMIDEKAFAHMPKNSLIINSSRGGLIDDNALKVAIQKEIISFAALDSVDPDPPYNISPDQCTYQHCWLNHPRIYYTPHIAAGTEDALRDVATTLALKVKEFFGNEKNII